MLQQHRAKCSYCKTIYLIIVCIDLFGEEEIITTCPNCGEVLGTVKGQPGFEIIDIREFKGCSNTELTNNLWGGLA